MAAWTPVFESIYQGSLRGRWPGAAVLLSLLPLADRHGDLVYSFDDLGGLTGWPQELLRQGVAQLEEPDPNSRSPSNDGRRLVRLRPSRDWGWHIVNHRLYVRRALKSIYDLERVASGSNAKRMRARRKTRQDPTGPDTTRQDPTLARARLNPDSDSEILPTSDSSSILKPLGAAPKKTRSNGTRIPDDFELTPERRDRAEKELPRVDAEKLFEEFRNHWLAAAGANARKCNWNATWLNWIARAAKYGYPTVQVATRMERVVRIGGDGKEIVDD